MQKLAITCSSDSLHTFNTFVFSVFYIISIHQLCFLYMLNHPVLLFARERERAAVNMQGTVFILARLKIVPTIKNLYHIQCQNMLMN